MADLFISQKPDDTIKLFKESQLGSNSLANHADSLAVKLNNFALLLGLSSYNSENEFQAKLEPISNYSIQPLHIICPASFAYETITCNPQSLLQDTRSRDIPLVTLIKGTTVYQNVPMLTEKCPFCKTSYTADHEWYKNHDSQWHKFYLNSARFLKVG